jgi:hypothetical protein
MKTASAPTENYLIKEASELADALEFMAHSSVNNGSAADSVRGEMVRSFFKSAMKGTSHAGSPAQGETMTSGMQDQAPAHGKKKIAINNATGGSPAQGSATPEAKDGEKVMLETYKQAEGQSLYDILMANKVAGHGGPAEMTASEDAPGIPSGNENAGRQSMLGDNESPVRYTRRQAKATTRARLAEAFAHTSDTTGDAGVKAMFPIGAGKGTHKIASDDKDPFKVFGQRPTDPSSYKKMRRTAIKSHGMSGKRRMQLMQKSLEGRGEDKRRTTYRSIAGAAAGGGVGSLTGGSTRSRVIKGLVGGLGAGTLSGLRSEANRLKAKKKSQSPAAVMAELGKTRTKRRVRSEAKTLAKLQAARQGRKVQGRPLIRIDRADGGK